jgi:hypothetical protein
MEKNEKIDVIKFVYDLCQVGGLCKYFDFLHHYSGNIVESISIGHYRSFPSTAAKLITLKKVVSAGKHSSSYERIKNKQMTVLLSNQKLLKQYTLIL